MYRNKPLNNQKIDVVLWTKNGENTLPRVLDRLNQVIPEEFVNKKILIDDASTDSTCKIGKDFGWIIISNKGTGIADGANTALEAVTTEYFLSIEQDLELATDFFIKAISAIKESGVAVFSGLKIADQPVGLRAIHQYYLRKYGGEFLVEKLNGRSLDNTLYKTAIVRDVGGFKKLVGYVAGTDSLLFMQMKAAGFKWVVDQSVVSTHIRGTLKNELRHVFICAQTSARLFKSNLLLSRLLPALGFSPIRAVVIALRMRCPSVIFVYPLINFMMFRGVQNGIKISGAKKRIK